MNNTLVAGLWTASADSKLRQIGLAFAGSILLAISSKFQIPFYPVPLTMQTFVVVAIGMAFGWKLGMATIILYLAEGAAGLPVFAGTPEKGIGLAYMLSGTGGYLLGYVLAAGIAGYLAQQGWTRSLLSTAAAAFLATVMIYAPGLLWLGALFGWDKPILEWGLYPFVYGDLLKIALVAAAFPMMWKLMDRKQR
jgi:biotin transport system substrate-specific component